MTFRPNACRIVTASTAGTRKARWDTAVGSNLAAASFAATARRTVANILMSDRAAMSK